MAFEFLKTLPKISTNDLPADSKTCIICTDEYNTAPSPSKPAEHPVQLPCLHIIGANCIAKWLTERSNSCPYCRREFFPRALPEDMIEIGDDIIWMGGLNNIEIAAILVDIDINLPSYPDELEINGASDEFELRLSDCTTGSLEMLHLVAPPDWDEEFPVWNEDALGWDEGLDFWC